MTAPVAPSGQLVPKSHAEYLDCAISAEPFCEGYYRRDERDWPRHPRFWYLVDGVAKRWGWSSVDEPGHALERHAVRAEARKVAREIGRR